MGFQFPPIAFVLFFATAVAVASGISAWRHRDVPGSVQFVVLMALVACWALTYGLQLVFVSLDSQLFWDSMQYLPGGLTPVAFLVFVLSYTGRGQLITPGRLAAVASVPLLTGVVVWIPDLRWLVRSSATLTEVNSFLLASLSYGPLFFLTVIHGYLVIGAGIAMLVNKTRRTPEIYRRHSLLITVGAVVPVFGSTISYVFEWTPIDMTPVGLSVFGVTVVIALTQYRLLDVVPVARDRIITEVDEGVVVTDSNDRIVDINPAAREILAIDEKIGTTLSAVDSGRVEGLTAMEAETSMELVVPGGTDRYYECQKTTIAEPSTHQETTIYIIHDVTERRTREAWFRSLTEYSSDIICVLDEEIQISYVSPSIERILGYEPAAIEGDPLLGYVHEEDRSELREQLLTERGEPAQLTYRVQAADGEWRSLQSRSRNRLTDPTVEGIIVNIRDITEIQAREQELQEKNERLDMFARVVSHDLRNPLSVATGRTELLAEALPDEGEYTEQLDALSRSLSRMDEIVEGTLSLARQGTGELDVEYVEFSDWLRQSWGMVETGTASLEIRDELTLVGDREQLRHLSENCFRNAIEHAGKDVTVRAGRHTDRGIYIEDDGPGIPPEERASLLEPDDDGQLSFGLTIIKRIANAHDWKMTVTESADGGARFEFTGVRIGESGGTSQRTGANP